MYSILPSFVLAFHGCDKSVAETVLTGKSDLHPSRNKYDWLGEGIYFWENSPARAMTYARFLKGHPRRGGPKIKAPAVIGAAIDLGYCLNLLDAKFLQVVKDGYEGLREAFEKAEMPLPQNTRAGPNNDLLLRDLDCAVINFVHQARSDAGLRPFDTVRAAFIEGAPLYPGSGFSSLNHIQICVRDIKQIKGYFRPMGDIDQME